jgi:hypothetical protein
MSQLITYLNVVYHYIQIRSFIFHISNDFFGQTILQDLVYFLSTIGMKFQMPQTSQL